MATILLIGIIFGPLIVLTLLKVNAIFVYLSLCLGEILSLYVSSNYQVNNLVINTQVINQHFSTSSDIKLGLLLLPPVLTTLFMLRTTKGHKLSLNLIPALAVGVLAVFLVVPLLPQSSSASILTSSVWMQLINHQDIIVGVSSAAVLALLLLQRSKFVSAAKRRKHHRE